MSMRLANRLILGLLLSMPLAAQQDGKRPGPPKNPALVLNEEGVKLYLAGRYDEAVPKFEAARRLQPKLEVLSVNLGNALYGRGVARGKKGDTKKALADLRRAAGLNPKEPLIQVAHGRLWMQTGDLEHARTILEKALKRFPGRAACHEAMGRLEYAEEHLREALQFLETAAKLEPARAPQFAAFLAKVRREATVEGGFFVEKRGPFTVKYDDEKFRGVSQDILGILDKNYNAIGQDLGHWPRRQLSVVLYTRGDFNRATGAHGWTGGLFDGKIRLPVRNFKSARGAIESTLTHELSHFFIRSITRHCPLWLDEGLAQVRQGRRPSSVRALLKKNHAGGTLPRVARIPGSWTGIRDPKRVGLYYAVALSFSAWLRKEYGQAALLEILEKLDGKRSFSACFHDVLATRLVDAEEAWRQEL